MGVIDYINAHCEASKIKSTDVDLELLVHGSRRKAQGLRAQGARLTAHGARLGKEAEVQP
jgi:hypothetical protein